MILRAAATFLLVVAFLSAAACESTPRGSTPSQRRSSTLPVEEIQAEIMAFADSYTAMINQAANQVIAQRPERAAVIHDLTDGF